MAYSTAVYTDFLSHRISEIEALLDDDPEILESLAQDETRDIPAFASAFDAVTVHREGRIIFANPAAAVIYGAETVNRLIGMDAWSTRTTGQWCFRAASIYSTGGA